MQNALYNERLKMLKLFGLSKKREAETLYLQNRNTIIGSFAVRLIKK